MTLQKVLKRYLYEQGISAREFGRRCGFSNTYVSVLISGKNPGSKKELKPTVETYEKIAKGMGISVQDLLSMIGFKSGLIVSDKTPYNPFYDEDNDAYGDDIEWRKMHGAIDDNENLRRIVTMCVGLDDATLKQIAAVIEVLINNGQKT